MSDIFISYSSEDRQQAVQLAQALAGQGWSVFWDRTTPPGKTWREFIGKELKDARCIVVAWSEVSIGSRWVCEEADEGNRRRILVPAFIENVMPPFGFRSLQAADLSAWDGSPTDAAFRTLVIGIAGVLGPPPAEVEAKRQDERERRKRAEAEAERKAEEEGKRAKAEAERKAEEERKRAKAEAERKAEEERKRAKAEAERKAEEERKRAVAEAKREAEEARKRAEAKANVPRTTLEREMELEPEMVRIGQGTFLIGSAKGSLFLRLFKGEAFADGCPQHKVRIARPFAMGSYPVTFEEYDAFVKAAKRELPGDLGWGRGKRPVINVSWDDAVAYAQWLSGQTGKRYRLPTEAEWEYATRAGTSTRWSFGDDKQALGKHAWYSKNAGSKTHPVGEKAPNPWGLHDVHGNVWEWVADCWHDSYEDTPTNGSAWQAQKFGDCGRRVLRGGSWDEPPAYVRSAFRNWSTTDFRNNYLGFRLARDL